MKAIIMKWLPGSGKSTRANDLASKENYKIVSKDQIRLYVDKEKDVWIEQDRLIEQYAKEWQNIIIDNTHMSIKTLTSLQSKLVQLWYEVEIKDMRYDVQNFVSNAHYLEACLERNMLREWSKCVPDSVIYEMYLYEYNIGRPAYIFDIDWTIANLEHRLHYIKWEVKDHKSFLDNTSKDTPIYPTIRILQCLKQLWYTIVLVSGRSDVTCEDTKERLLKNNIEYDFLLMRKSRDHRPDYMVKEDIYEKCLKKEHDKILWVFEDRKQVKRMWVSKWLFVFDVNQTDADF